MKEKEIENLQIELDQANELIVELKQELAELKKPPAGIEECLLSDEEIKTIEGRVFRECQPAGYDFELKVQRAVAQAQLEKVKPYINQKVEQVRKEERERILADIQNSFSATNYLSPEAGREPVNAIGVIDWERIKQEG